MCPNPTLVFLAAATVAMKSGATSLPPEPQMPDEGEGRDDEENHGGR